MPTATTGSCLCNSVRYVINEDIKSAVNCHCNICKKITGGAFETIVVIEEKSLQITAGADLLTRYQVSDNAMKHFCSKCGTPIYNRHKLYPGRCMVQVGSFDDPTAVAPAANIFCESMLPWVKQIGELHCFEQLPPK